MRARDAIVRSGRRPCPGPFGAPGKRCSNPACVRVRRTYYPIVLERTLEFCEQLKGRGARGVDAQNAMQRLSLDVIMVAAVPGGPARGGLWGVRDPGLPPLLLRGDLQVPAPRTPARTYRCTSNEGLSKRDAMQCKPLRACRSARPCRTWALWQIQQIRRAS